MLIPNAIYNFINSRNGKSFFGFPLRISDMNGRMMVVKWKSKQWTLMKSKKSKNYRPTSEEEKLLASLDDMRTEFQKQTENLEKEQMKGFYTLLFGLFTFVLSTVNAYALYITNVKIGEYSYGREAFGIGRNALFLGVVYIAIIGVSTSVAIKEKRLDFNHAYRLCRNLFWFTIVVSISCLYPFWKTFV